MNSNATSAVLVSTMTPCGTDVERPVGGLKGKHHAAEATLAALEFNSMAEVLAYRAGVEPDATAFIHLLDGEEHAQAMSYAELWQRARSLADALVPLEVEGKRVLMLFEAGLDYVTALFALFLTGATAVPSFPPIGSRALERLGLITADAEPALVLTNGRFSRLRERMQSVLPADFPADGWIDIDQLTLSPEQKNNHIVQPVPDRSRLALLQYTSGSTAAPKGVMLTHGNLLSNCRTASSWMGGKRSRMGVTWLPPYHDMGLMGGILQPIYEGFPTVILAPVHFVQRPWRWLAALSRYRATVTIAPNFAFDLCVEGINDSEMTGLDLSSLQEIYCGAEPVRKSTFDRFATRFSGTGFNPRAFGPCYGLAEASVFVSGKPVDSSPVFIQVDKEALATGQLRMAQAEGPDTLALASSGVVAPEHRLAIVDPVTLVELEEGKVGEIWVQGSNIGAGYWRKPESTESCFYATLPATAGRFMRTGDLGLLWQDELYVTGRLKDLIIVAGRNLYPQDLELCAQEADLRLRPNGVVALALDDGQRELIVIVAEIKRSEKLNAKALDELRQQLMAALTSSFGVAPSTIHFAPVGSIPLTTSGKPQRQATKKAFIDGTLPRYVAQ